MTFRNSVVGGTTLVRPAIQSPNFVTGTSGWSIDRDGSAEFNNVTIRGGTVVSGTSLYYNGTPAAGNLFGSLSSSSGTDSFGNAYPAGFQVRNTAGGGTFVTLTPTGTLQVGNSNEWDNPATLSAQPSLASFGFSTILGSAWNNTGSGTDIAAMTLDPGDVSTHGTVVFQSPMSSVPVDMELSGQITGYDGNTFTTYTPTVTGDGTATYNVQTGWYQRVGKMIFFAAYLTVNAAGSGAANVQIDAPTSIDRTTRQVVSVHCEGLGAGDGSSELVAFTGGSGATWDRLRMSTGANITGADLSASGIVIAEGWYREV